MLRTIFPRVGKQNFIFPFEQNRGYATSKGSDFGKPLPEKILIANRGEIACRIIRTAKKLGIKTVSVYSSADKDSLHSQMADEAYCIGPAPSSESYLNVKKLIEVTKATNSTAIHPGYGFLSENHNFATELKKAGIVFIGPSAEAMKSMGSKSEAKKIMEAAGVPITPGYHGEDQTVEVLKREAAKISYPIMIKAVMGGGGKGMRIVENEEEFEEKLQSSKSESRKHFSDDRVILEKYIRRSRHIEVQIFADRHGNAVYLFERDCSIQRRHQKILEEAPAPGISEEQRRDLGEKAVLAAKAVNYEGAGTVEFIWDCDTNKFYFMEMNTRLQVEHPVTEMITGLDLVQWQFEIAAGRPLLLTQEQINRVGHAIEARIYAENTENNFMPDTGEIKFLETPATSSNIRVESGIRQGDQVSVHYDPMIAKLIVSGQNRQQAVKKIADALKDFKVVGVRTNIEFIQKILSRKEYLDEKAVDTGFIQTHSADLFGRTPVHHDQLIMASLFLLYKSSHYQDENFMFENFSSMGQRFSFEEQNAKAEIFKIRNGDFMVKTTVSENGSAYTQNTICEIRPAGNKTFDFIIGDKTWANVTVYQSENELHIFSKGFHHTLVLKKSSTQSSTKSNEAENGILSPMPCKIASIPVKAGQKVTKGTPLMILEAMKMEHVIKAPFDGTVAKILHQEGEVVGEKKKLLEFS